MGLLVLSMSIVFLIFSNVLRERHLFSQGARNLKIRSARLTRQKRFDCIDDKNYPSVTFLGTVEPLIGHRRLLSTNDNKRSDCNAYCPPNLMDNKR